MKIVPKKLIVVSLALIFSVVLFGCTKKTNSLQVKNEVQEGKLVVKVLDKSTKKPIADANIIVMESNGSYKTDEKGLSPEIAISINKDSYKKYGDDLLRKAPSGDVTIMITKDGYKDYVIFNKTLYPGAAPNSMDVQMVKLAKNDKEKYVTDIQTPNESWVEELIAYCKGIKDENLGTGNNKLALTISGRNSKPAEGAMVYIPELNLMGKTDAKGKVEFKITPNQLIVDKYAVKKNYQEYTIVTIKDGYTDNISFNVPVHEGKDNNLNISIKPSDSSKGSGLVMKYEPIDKEWIEKLIQSYKK